MKKDIETGAFKKDGEAERIKDADGWLKDVIVSPL